ncbi:hypothetical protein [Nocardiopsis tropica]|uniref:Uncharacterized protein n=1 Tax=Nocardiopsis tropica TaxID=109330 RepID=A0ABU7KUB1_9ACTN|nr:hypothetical protein [Nocardiopsis umidischolae]MEE2052878.1 hypothetical protein [Nocardiopsis umidischolae]
MAKQEKKIQSIETNNGVTVITYEDGSQEIQHGGGTISAGTITGGVSFSRKKK